MYGVVAVVVALELLIAEFILLGQHTMVLRFYQTLDAAVFRLRYAAALVMITAAGLFLGGTVALLPDVVFEALSDAIERRHALLLVFAVICQSLIALLLALLRARENLTEYGQVRLGAQGFKLAGIAAGVAVTPTLDAYVAGLLLGQFVALALFVRRIILPAHATPAAGKPGRSAFLRNFTFGMPLMVHGFIGAAYSVFDRLALGNFMPPEKVAVYNFAAVQGTAAFFVINILAITFMPRFYADAGWTQNAKRYLDRFLRAALLVSACFMLLIYLVIFPLSLRFVDAIYADGRDVLLIFFAVLLLQCFSNYGVYKLTIMERTRLIPVATGCVLTAVVALNVVLIPQYGILGAALAVLFSEFLNALLLIFFGSGVAQAETG